MEETESQADSKDALETPQPDDADIAVENSVMTESSLDDRKDVPEKTDEIFNLPEQGRCLCSLCMKS